MADRSGSVTKITPRPAGRSWGKLDYSTYTVVPGFGEFLNRTIDVPIQTVTVEGNGPKPDVRRVLSLPPKKK